MDKIRNYSCRLPDLVYGEGAGLARQILPASPRSAAAPTPRFLRLRNSRHARDVGVGGKTLPTLLPLVGHPPLPAVGARGLSARPPAAALPTLEQRGGHAGSDPEAEEWGGRDLAAGPLTRCADGHVEMAFESGRRRPAAHLPRGGGRMNCVVAASAPRSLGN